MIDDVTGPTCYHAACKSLAFGIGHFYNDLCASMWFTYLLEFFANVRQIGPAQTGFLMLWGTS